MKFNLKILTTCVALVASISLPGTLWAKNACIDIFSAAPEAFTRPLGSMYTPTLLPYNALVEPGFEGDLVYHPPQDNSSYPAFWYQRMGHEPLELGQNFGRIKHVFMNANQRSAVLVSDKNKLRITRQEPRFFKPTGNRNISTIDLSKENLKFNGIFLTTDNYFVMETVRLDDSSKHQLHLVSFSSGKIEATADLDYIIRGVFMNFGQNKLWFSDGINFRTLQKKGFSVWKEYSSPQQDQISYWVDRAENAVFNTQQLQNSLLMDIHSKDGKNLFLVYRVGTKIAAIRVNMIEGRIYSRFSQDLSQTIVDVSQTNALMEENGGATLTLFAHYFPKKVTKLTFNLSF